MYRKVYKPSSVERYTFKDSFTASPDAYKMRIDPKYNDKEGRSNLHLAILQPADDECFVDYVIKAGCDVNTEDNMGRQAIHYAAEKGHIRSLQKLITNAAQLNILDREGLTPLMYASRMGHVDVMRILLKSGAHVNFTNEKMETALHYAVGASKFEATNLLIESRANANHQDEAGNSALIIASRLSNVDIVKLLLENGRANPNLEDSFGLTALHWVAKLGHPDCVKILIEGGADIEYISARVRGSSSPFVLSIKGNNAPVMRVLLDSKCDTSSIDGLNGTALGLSSILGHVSCVEVLLEYGEDPNETGYFGMTSLMSAAFESRVDVVDLLLAKGADPNQNSRTGGTALIKAFILVSEKNEVARHNIVAKLIRANADVEKRAVTSSYFTAITNGKNDPMSFAITSGYVSFVRMLLLAGSVVKCQELCEWFRTTDIDRTFDKRDIFAPIIESKSQVTPLRHFCRMVIRKQLGNRVLRGIEVLPIAPPLKRYLNLEELDYIKPQRAHFAAGGAFPFFDFVTVAPCGLRAIEGTLIAQTYQNSQPAISAYSP